MDKPTHIFQVGRNQRLTGAPMVVDGTDGFLTNNGAFYPHPPQSLITPTTSGFYMWGWGEHVAMYRRTVIAEVLRIMKRESGIEMSADELKVNCISNGTVFVNYHLPQPSQKYMIAMSAVNDFFTKNTLSIIVDSKLHEIRGTWVIKGASKLHCGAEDWRLAYLQACSFFHDTVRKLKNENKQTTAMLDERLSEIKSRSRPPSPSHYYASDCSSKPNNTTTTSTSSTSPRMLFGGNPVWDSPKPLSPSTMSPSKDTLMAVANALRRKP